jgi:hypothetical protein
MQLPLRAWYALREIRQDGAELRARFLPDFFDQDIAEPALELVVVQPINAVESLAQLARFKEDPVTDATVSDNTVELFAEYDDEPTRICGQSVSWSWSPYTSTELLELIAGFVERADIQHKALTSLQRQLKSSIEYSTELLHRAEVKKALTQKSTATMDAQIEVLQRVLARLRDA